MIRNSDSYRTPCILTLIALPCFIEGSTLRFESFRTAVDLLALSTSEGCSSCPPADRWLSRFADSPRLWKRHVAIAFHVDYWDYIGWRDQFAKPESSDRQRSIARIGSARVYNPAVFLNGRESGGDSSKESIYQSPKLRKTSAFSPQSRCPRVGSK